jgi:hypothetical protein
MPIEYDRQLELFRVVLVGKITMDRIFDLLTRILAHPDFKPGLAAIWDSRNADLSALRFEDMQQFRRFQEVNAATRGRARIALVASSELSFGIGRMFEQVADLPNLEINVFRDMQAAESWAQSKPSPP